MYWLEPDCSISVYLPHNLCETIIHIVYLVAKYRVQQQAGLAVDHPFDGPDLTENSIELKQRRHPELGDEIPPTVGRMKRVHLGQAPKQLDHLVRRSTLNLDQRDRPDTVVLVSLLHPNGETEHGGRVE